MNSPTTSGRARRDEAGLGAPRAPTSQRTLVPERVACQERWQATGRVKGGSCGGLLPVGLVTGRPEPVCGSWPRPWCACFPDSCLSGGTGRAGSRARGGARAAAVPKASFTRARPRSHNRGTTKMCRIVGLVRALRRVMWVDPGGLDVRWPLRETSGCRVPCPAEAPSHAANRGSVRLRVRAGR
jgi:hypothetical protein